MAEVKSSQSKPEVSKSSDAPVVDTTGILNVKKMCKDGSALDMVLEEVLVMAEKVSKVSFNEGGGRASCIYNTKTEKPISYELVVQKENVGNLVHELIHVAVNEAYRADFINFPTDQSANIPKRVLTASGYCENEEDRQRAWRKSNGQTEKIEKSLGKLDGAALTKDLTKGISDDQVDMISKKLLYGQVNAYKEYHTVITQILVWLYEWNCTDNSFCKMLESHVETAFQERQEASKCNGAT